MSLLNHSRPSGKLARWALTIQDMDLVIKYRSGKSNTNADALSRNPVTQPLRAAHVDTSHPVEEPIEEPKTPSRELTRSVQVTAYTVIFFFLFNSVHCFYTFLQSYCLLQVSACVGVVSCVHCREATFIFTFFGHRGCFIVTIMEIRPNYYLPNTDK